MFDRKETRIESREVNRARYAGPLICVQGFARDPKSITLNSLHFRPILCGQGEEWIREAGLGAGSFLRRLLQNSRSASEREW